MVFLRSQTENTSRKELIKELLNLSDMAPKLSKLTEICLKI